VFLFFNLRREMDRYLQQQFETVERLLVRLPDGTLRLDLHRHEEAGPGPGLTPLLIDAWSPDGKRVYADTMGNSEIFRTPPEPVDDPASFVFTSMTAADGQRLRLISGSVHVGGMPLLIRVASSEEHLWHEMREYIGVLLLGFPIVLLLAAMGGYGLARRALSPIDRMTRQAQTISAERLDERLLVDNPDDELGHLARVLNAMLDRIHRAFEQLRRFTADASHELRTPLTALRSVGEVGLQPGQDPAAYREVIGSMLEEVDRLTHLIDCLLLLSRADTGQIRLNREPLSLAGLVRECCDLLEVLAEEKRQAVQIRNDASVMVSADRSILRQALMNVIDNAIKYSPEEGRIVVRTNATAANEAVVEVIDTGPGIASEHQPHVFERFYRVDRSRSREMGGVGLGLAITRWAVEAHDGRVELESAPDAGCVFRIVLPLSRGQYPPC
jgi:heavy metal sensor kinase